MLDTCEKHDFVVSYLTDDSLFESTGKVTDDQKRCIYKGLIDMPLSTVKAMRNARIKITIADESAFKEIRGKNSNGFFRPNRQRNLNPFIKISKGHIVINARAGRSSSCIRRTLRHEAGHALDFVNGKKRHASDNSVRFQQEVQNYLERKKGTPATEIQFEHDSSFRRDHLPSYKLEKAGRELVAELFNKYCALSSRYTPQKRIFT